MAENTPKAALQDLHAMLEAADTDNPDVIRALQADVRETIERMERDEPHDENLAERLQNAIAHFEVEHPQLTLRVQSVIDALANAGL